MEFLVHITILLPETTSAREREDLSTREAARAAELYAEHVLVRIWRDPGRAANWSLYRVADATALHEALSSLPLFPWMKIKVHPLATHPVEAKASPGRQATKPPAH